MRVLNVGRVLVEHRRRRGFTQDEVAAFLGVSKAAVSKWETGNSYPDITLLPQLAAFFDITIDELMDYKPQMSSEDMRKLYAKLSAEFAALSFEEVLGHCRYIIRRYYSCFPLLFHIGSLLVNHCAMAGTAERTEQIVREALDLFRRVKEETDDVQLGKEALHMEAYCLLILKEPEEVLELLGRNSLYASPKEPILASAFELVGQRGEAVKMLQAAIFQSLIGLLELLSSYLRLCSEEAKVFEKTVRRILELADAFELEKLHPSILLTCYMHIAQGYAALGREENALETLGQYTDLACGDIYPLRLHGDSYFNLLDGWIQENLYLGDALPREESLIRRSLTQALAENPAFSNLSAQPRFLEMARRLKRNEEE